MLPKGLSTMILVIVAVFLMITGTSNSQQGATPQKDKPSVDRLNVEDFERKAEPPRQKPKARPQPKGVEVPPPPVEKQPDVLATRDPAPGEIWREPLTGLEFVWVPAGCFEMGSPPDEKGRKSDEELPHNVCLKGLWLGKTEVTVGAFHKFVEVSGYRTEAEREGFAWFSRGKEWLKRPKASWREPGIEQREDHPVVNVSWNDAKAMAEWLSRQGKGAYRLPTEAEWEYGCRAGTKTARFWGDSPAEACRYANVADRSARKAFAEVTIHECDDGYLYTAPVGSFQANGFGLLDMLGNAAEWSENRYTTSAKAPQPMRERVVNSGQPDRVVLDGGWLGDPNYVRCAARSSHDPVLRRSGLGFRLVKTE